MRAGVNIKKESKEYEAIENLSVDFLGDEEKNETIHNSIINILFSRLRKIPLFPWVGPYLNFGSLGVKNSQKYERFLRIAILVAFSFEVLFTAIDLLVT